MADISQGLINLVVVYKVDRLTRSLADFAKMVEAFDAHGVSFVSVTQQFNTTTSMGRLTLNVLLSFAQFEREVTGERIRDKIAASKRKGMWMGGLVPMGYDVRDRHLVVNQAEAATVREIFRCYLELGSVRLLKAELDRRGLRSKVRTANNGLRSGGNSFYRGALYTVLRNPIYVGQVSRSGKARGGKQFSRGALYHLLSNPIYLGEIRHKHERHPGLHEAIVSRELWERVQQRLRDQGVRSGAGRKTEAPSSPLAGKLFDESGEPLYVQGAAKGRRRYRYYVSRTLVRGNSDGTEQGWRISAPEIERRVAAAAQAVLGDRPAIAVALEASGVDPNRLPSVLKSAHGWIERLASRSEAAAALDELIERVQLNRESLHFSLKLPLALTEPDDGASPVNLLLSRLVPMQMKRRGVEMWIVLQGDSNSVRVDLPLLKAVARAHRWADDLVSGKVRSVGELARREGIDGRSVRRLIPLGFLSPRIVEAIAEGRQPVELTAEALTRRIDLPLLWSAQEQALGIE
jgi:site-specific DNA recombinase